LVSTNLVPTLLVSQNPNRFKLTPTGLELTSQGREKLTYLISCALNEDIELYTEVDGKVYTFLGSMGLAPRWLEKPLTPSEERWVSACMLARTNFWGVKVIISMRASPPPTMTLTPTVEETRNFSLYEGDFYGNIFQPFPVAYTCVGQRTCKEDQDPILNLRICTRSLGIRHPSGYEVTPCGFLLTGQCQQSSHTVQGQTYNEVISIYLKPVSKN
jgi:hypothetical protein